MDGQRLDNFLMAHFAKLNDQDVVIDVVVVSNDSLENLPFPESEPAGIEFLSRLFDGYKNWKQTSYNASFRKNYAGIGYTYDKNWDAFIPPKPFPSWNLDTTIFQWMAPIPYPDPEKWYRWNEELQQWVEVTG